MAYETKQVNAKSVRAGDRVVIGTAARRVRTVTVIASGEIVLTLEPVFRRGNTTQAIFDADDELDVVVGGWPDRPTFTRPPV